jgi:hypothetical protein
LPGRLGQRGDDLPHHSVVVKPGYVALLRLLRSLAIAIIGTRWTVA